MSRLCCRVLLVLHFGALAGTSLCQEIHGTYADLTVPGNWQPAKQFAAGNSALDIYYDSASGALLLVSQQAGLLRVGEIAKFFSAPPVSNNEAASVMSAAEFPLPSHYTDRAAKDLAKGSKPPRMWDMKEGEGSPVWFYASQLFDEYRVKDAGGSSETKELFMPVRISKAEQRSISGGDVLLFEVETERLANDAAIKRFHMPGGLRDQRLRYGWIQFAPGGIASGQGVLSIGIAVPANSTLSVEEVVKQLSAAKMKQL